MNSEDLQKIKNAFDLCMKVFQRSNSLIGAQVKGKISEVLTQADSLNGTNFKDTSADNFNFKQDSKDAIGKSADAWSALLAILNSTELSNSNDGNEIKRLANNFDKNSPFNYPGPRGEYYKDKERLVFYLNRFLSEELKKRGPETAAAPVKKQLLKITSIDEIDRIEEKHLKMSYTMYFKDKHNGLNILPTSVSYFHRGITPTKRWSAFVHAVYGNPLVSQDKFRVNEALRELLGNNSLDFFEGDIFKFKVKSKASRKDPYKRQIERNNDELERRAEDNTWNGENTF